jgi:hypothetical protein
MWAFTPYQNYNPKIERGRVSWLGQLANNKKRAYHFSAFPPYLFCYFHLHLKGKLTGRKKEGEKK